MTSLKKSLNNLLETQIKDIELLKDVITIYSNSKEFYNYSSKEEQDLVLKLKELQEEYTSTINKLLKY